MLPSVNVNASSKLLKSSHLTKDLKTKIDASMEKEINGKLMAMGKK